MKDRFVGFLMGVAPVGLFMTLFAFAWAGPQPPVDIASKVQERQVISTKDFVMIGCYRFSALGVGMMEYRVGYFEDDEYKEEHYLPGRTNVIREGVKEYTKERRMIEITHSKGREVNIILHGSYAAKVFRDGCSLSP